MQTMQTSDRMASVQTSGGKMDLFVAHPAGTGPYPVVVMYHNVGGLSPLLMALARRVASNGYYCAMPDLYYRLGKIIIDPDNKDPHVLAVRKAVIDSLSDAGVMADTRDLLNLIEGDPAARK